MINQITPSRLGELGGYADALWELAFAKDKMKNAHIPTILDDINLFEEVHHINDMSKIVIDNMNSVDVSIIKVGGYYKEEDNTSYSWNGAEYKLYHVLSVDVDETHNDISVDIVRITLHGVYYNDSMVNSPRNARWFAGRLKKGKIVEITKEEFDEAVEAYNNYNRIYEKHGGEKFKEYDID